MLNKAELEQRKQDYLSGLNWDELGEKWNVCRDGARMFVKYQKVGEAGERI